MSSDKNRDRGKYDRFLAVFPPARGKGAKDSHTSVESEPVTDRLSTCRNDKVIAKVNGVVMRDHRVIIREIAEEMGISPFLAHSIVTDDFSLKIGTVKFKLLTVER